MGWSLMRMARYVKQTKYLQQLKENENVWSQSFPKASYLMFLKDRAFITASTPSSNSFLTKINWRSYEDVEPYCTDIRKSSIVLGVDEDADERALFACPVNPEKSDEIQMKFEGRFVDMRMSILSLQTHEAQFVGRAYTLLNWNETTKFCCHCGGPMEKTFSGCVRICSKKCDPHKSHQYPSIFPVAITRVLNHAGDKALLVRQPRQPKGMYSCIAGFMEPGETLQDNVRREIAEEAGIVVDQIAYFQSQTWPLPQPSLMLGCTAVALPGSEELDIDKNELEDGRWFTKAEVLEAFERIKENPAILRSNENNLLVIPPNGAIAHQLLQNWIEDYTPSQL